MKPVDHAIRQQAMDPFTSAIVSAPAGSGKTYLLTRRILNLLIHCDQPEEVIAITFTKKAAAEMKHRLIQCLTEAQEEPAINALKHSQINNWDILNNTHKLNIMTIDSFTAWLLDQGTPCISGKISASPGLLYRQVVYQYFQQDNWCEAQHILLKTLEGQYQRLETMLCDLLSSRDQWQSCLDSSIEGTSQQGIQALIAYYTHQCERYFSTYSTDIQALLANINHVTQRFESTTLYPNESTLHTYQSLHHILLTTTQQIRKKQNKKQGIYSKAFISAYPDIEHLQKQSQQTIETLSEYLKTSPEALEALSAVSLLPGQHNSDEVNFLKHLTTILRDLNQRLIHLLTSTQQTDFTQISHQAIHAIKHDTALQTFCKKNIKHILMDEFQDTAYGQYQLAEGIISTWDKHAHHTFFAVGDPMQSIYRFRQAEVGLFLSAQKKPIAHIQLTPLSLTCNFRSNQKMIEAVNEHFQEIFPESDNPLFSAIKYRPAIPTKGSNEDDGIYIQQELNPDPVAQASRIVSIIQSLQLKNPNSSIAILGQTRGQLSKIIPLLEQKNIGFNAIDIYPIMQLSAVSDLTALLGYLSNSSDTIAYFSILRSPLCGLSTQELYAQSNHAKHPHVLTLRKYIAHAKLRHPAAPVSQAWMIWSLLEGYKRYHHSQHHAIQQWFDVLLQLQSEHHPLDRMSIGHYFSRSFMSITQPNCKLSLLTSHKSKGLEYDHVIIPHCEKRKAPASTPLFYTESAFGPILQPNFLDNLQNSEYFKSLNKKRDTLESFRLLYVAATRAKNTLHIVGHFEQGAPTNSWLAMMLKKESAKHTHIITNHTEIHSEANIKPYHPRTITPLVAQSAPTVTLKESKVHSQADKGTALHLFMQYYTHANIEMIWQLHLKNHAFSHDEINELNQAKLQITKNLVASKNQWLLQAPSAYNEISFDGRCIGLNRVVIDRLILIDQTFWVIDYKFPNTFHNNEKIQDLYKKQVQEYMQIVQTHYPQYKIRGGVYLPYYDQWVEV
ncbi:UvrD-helicase domain-containing protein [Candidatus Comchoanobacter bicostacola]|uniref:DNA 3'-5' helicase n=1 Tax=Candidatus Comchoanobacter bicostacola TaxID=2919598 RepID=A0ABY5DKF1_9GAMM|nr:UvrD-helicase domain-containing protein [Candidatus Comchoanobacter bicostacola]UTC24976.1 UvrD-helicase domain-containing protein [Candidatus Comchoanobacter bicostacola]